MTLDQVRIVQDMALERQNAGLTPRVLKERKVEILKKLRGLVAGAALRDPKAWAHELQAREEAGSPLSPAQREMWRDALHIRRVPINDPDEAAF